MIKTVIMKISNIVLFILFASCSLAQHSRKDIQGTYSQQGNKNIKLIFDTSAFSYVDPYTNDLALYTCCDTITTGVWEIKNGLLYLSTPEIMTSITEVQVTEKSTIDNDTVYFYINNPVEDFYKSNNVKVRDLSYKVSIDAVSSDYFERAQVMRHDTNVIKLWRPRDMQIEKFYLLAYPNSNFSGRNIGIKEVRTFEYRIKDKASNVFEVNVPRLDYPFLSYLRLSNDFVRIINKNKLEWNGNFYLKEQ